MRLVHLPDAYLHVGTVYKQNMLDGSILKKGLIACFHWDLLKLGLERNVILVLAIWVERSLLIVLNYLLERPESLEFSSQHLIGLLSLL